MLRAEPELVRVRTYGFPGVLRGLRDLDSQLAPRSRPRRSLASPCMYDAQFSLPTAPPPTLVRAMHESRPQGLPPAAPHTAQRAPPASPTPPADTPTRPPWQDDSRPLHRQIVG